MSDPQNHKKKPSNPQKKKEQEHQRRKELYHDTLKQREPVERRQENSEGKRTHSSNRTEQNTRGEEGKEALREHILVREQSKTHEARRVRRHLKRDLLQRQKRPTDASVSGREALEKRPTIEAKETYYRGKRDLLTHPCQGGRHLRSWEGSCLRSTRRRGLLEEEQELTQQGKVVARYCVCSKEARSNKVDTQQGKVVAGARRCPPRYLN